MSRRWALGPWLPLTRAALGARHARARPEPGPHDAAGHQLVPAAGRCGLARDPRRHDAAEHGGRVHRGADGAPGEAGQAGRRAHCHDAPAHRPHRGHRAGAARTAGAGLPAAQGVEDGFAGRGQAAGERARQHPHGQDADRRRQGVRGRVCADARGRAGLGAARRRPHQRRGRRQEARRRRRPHPGPHGRLDLDPRRAHGRAGRPDRAHGRHRARAGHDNLHRLRRL